MCVRVCLCGLNVDCVLGYGFVDFESHCSDNTCLYNIISKDLGILHKGLLLVCTRRIKQSLHILKVCSKANKS